MAQPLCVILALCGIIFVAAEAGVLKSRPTSQPPGAIDIDFWPNQKTNQEGANPTEDGHEKETLYNAEDQIPVEEAKRDEDTEREIVLGFFIGTGVTCPLGRVRRGGVCIPA